MSGYKPPIQLKDAPVIFCVLHINDPAILDELTTFNQTINNYQTTILFLHPEDHENEHYVVINVNPANLKQKSQIINLMNQLDQDKIDVFPTQQNLAKIKNFLFEHDKSLDTGNLKEKTLKELQSIINPYNSIQYQLKLKSISFDTQSAYWVYYRKALNLVQHDYYLYYHIFIDLNTRQYYVDEANANMLKSLFQKIVELDYHFTHQLDYQKRLIQTQFDQAKQTHPIADKIGCAFLMIFLIGFFIVAPIVGMYVYYHQHIDANPKIETVLPIKKT